MTVPPCPTCRTGSPDVAMTGGGGEPCYWACTACGHEWQTSAPGDAGEITPERRAELFDRADDELARYRGRSARLAFITAPAKGAILDLVPRARDLLLVSQSG